MDKNIDYKRIGSSLKTIREEYCISLSKICTDLNISNTHLFNIENGNTNLSISMIIKILNYYNLSFSDVSSPDTNLPNLSYNIKKNFSVYDDDEVLSALDYLSDFLLQKTASRSN